MKHIADVLNHNSPAISFEFFPPKTEKASLELAENIKKLNAIKPAYVSVTYGAGGSTRELTHDLIIRLKEQTGLTIVSHLTCVGATQDEVYQILERYDQNQIHNIMALRGDPPKGQSHFQKTANGFNYASELVAFIKKNFPHMGVGVAGFPEGHPETPNRMLEMDYLKAKVDSGADYICTQMFFDNRDFYDFSERCEIAGIKIPIIAGIMPIQSLSGLKRMSELALGTRFPAKLMRALARAQGDDAIYRVGLHWATEQVRDLLDHNIRGIHFYTLNQSSAVLEMIQTLGLKDSDDLKKQDNHLNLQ